MLNLAIQFIANHGYFGVFILMIIENIIPAIPSEIVLPFIGHEVASNQMNFYVALISATAGSMLGTSVWFAVGWYLSADQLEKFLRKYGGYIAVSARDFHKARNVFTHYEVPAVFFGRMIPVIRGVISIPAGSIRMPFKTFFLYSLLGSLIWNGGLMYLGSAIFTDFTALDVYIAPLTKLLVYSFIALYGIHIIRFNRKARRTT
jgi:membrane protein DedA with SNARE-associated domain